MPWAEPVVVDPPEHGDERASLVGFLQRQRDLVAWKLTGVDDDVLRSVRTPSGMTLPGLVRHLENVERSWIRDDFAGQAGLVFDWTEEDRDGEWKVPDDVPMSAVLAGYAAESAICDAVIAGASLDDVTLDGRFSLRWVLLHLIEETARHLGHIDLLRENADGTVGEEPDR
jgi:hypothetical protein